MILNQIRPKSVTDLVGTSNIDEIPYGNVNFRLGNRDSIGTGIQFEGAELEQSASIVNAFGELNIFSVKKITLSGEGLIPPIKTATEGSALTGNIEGQLMYVTNTNGTFTTKGWYGYNGSSWVKFTTT